MATPPQHRAGGPPPGIPPASGPPGPPSPHVRQPIEVTPGTAFKTGFFFTLGAAVAGLIVGIVYFLVFVVILGGMITTMTQPMTYY